MFARLAEQEFDRCPVTFRTVASVMLVKDAAEGKLDEMGYTAKQRMPAKRLKALYYAAFLLKLRDANVD